MTLLGFFDRHGNGLAVDLTPEMAANVARQVRDIFGITTISPSFEGVSEVRLARHAFEDIYAINWQYIDGENKDSFFPFDGEVYDSLFEPTGVFVDVENDEPEVFWEYYNSTGRWTTPYLSLSQLDAIADNQPLPTEE